MERKTIVRTGDEVYYENTLKRIELFEIIKRNVDKKKAFENFRFNGKIFNFNKQYYADEFESFNLFTYNLTLLNLLYRENENIPEFVELYNKILCYNIDGSLIDLIDYVESNVKSKEYILDFAFTASLLDNYYKKVKNLV